ncbi:MAG: hypothetical protein SOY89_09580 [Dysosmobacter sp.]|nr:hypothetical protein [Dysosmobacter sp.]
MTEYDHCVIGGVIREDSSLWKWETGGKQKRLVKESNHILKAVDADHFISTQGKLYSDNGVDFLPTMSRSISTIEPILRNIAILFWLAYKWLLRKERQECNSPRLSIF